MKILVTGGRDFNNKDLLFDTLDKLHAESPITLLIHGASRGADSLASEWAKEHGVAENGEKPNWKLGRGAGLIRNKEMLAQNPDLVVAFPGKKGTEDMVRKAQAAGRKVLKIAG